MIVSSVGQWAILFTNAGVLCCWYHGVEHGIKKQAANGAIKEEFNLIGATNERNVPRLTLTDYVKKKKAGV